MTSSPRLVIDAGVEHLRLRVAGFGAADIDEVIPNHGDFALMLSRRGWLGRLNGHASSALITGKLAPTVRTALGGGRLIDAPEALWMAGRDLIVTLDPDVQSLAMVDLSASGYLLVGVARSGRLARDLLVVNPRCGAGSGINLDRVLQKLAIPREGVDALLAAYAGDAGRDRRAAVPTRADRCGVFASSATISDKNQGIPLDVALATTLKSEVLKACRRLPDGFDAVCYTGRIFRWQFARDVAGDYARERGTRHVLFDSDNTHVMNALSAVRPAEAGRDPGSHGSAAAATAAQEIPAFADVRARQTAAGRYLRLPDQALPPLDAASLMRRPVILALDVGSTMAKAVVADAATGAPLFRSTHSNAGDTIETVKRIWRDLRASGVTRLQVRGLGITGSARYQVQQAIVRLYPALADRVTVLVENYAHARGSLDEAQQHVERLSAAGVRVNRDLCVLVDVGGEDTKISTIALARRELYANAMNLKCSAGTGSLIDTLAALFGLPDVASACAEAVDAPRAFAINATCAVFLMENARRLQAQGVPRAEILASADWAIVENMARSLWGQIDLPRDAVVLLHGQTMRSDPLPLAVTERLQTYIGAPAYALVPPDPGHRACVGLVRTLMPSAPSAAAPMRLDDFIEASFDKRIIECRGAACGDDRARCARTSLACRGADGQQFRFTLGGCTAINDLFSRRGAPGPPPARDAYKEIWDFIASRQPASRAPERLVIPRAFCLSEWALFFASVFEHFGVPVHVDHPTEHDLLSAQGRFHADTCAPQMGAVGQIARLAAEPHGLILLPQIEDLPLDGAGPALTCTVNQGGLAVARSLALESAPGARLHLCNVRLRDLDAGTLADQLGPRLAEAFAQYGLAPSAEELRAAIARALDRHRAVRRDAADLAARLIEEAQAEGRRVAVVVGREYVLTPGLYDSSVRRLLHDRRICAIPSYVLDVTPDEAFDGVYWRNPRVILSTLKAIATRTLHARLTHPGLAALFRTLETDADPSALLPVVQVSTFSCGPDSVTAHQVADIMRHRPFLLLQSDAVLKQLAHLENRVNTYLKQLDLGLHAALSDAGNPPVEIARIQLANRTPLDPARDVICIPTMGDNRAVTSVLRAAGFTCLETYDGATTLSARVRAGRQQAGDAVCAPLAAVYGDLLAAVDQFRRRRAAGDPSVTDKTRLLYFDNQGGGPCRQGQYAALHQLMAAWSFTPDRQTAAAADAVPGLPIADDARLQFLIAEETRGFEFGIPEWAMYRAYQAVVVQGLLQELWFASAGRCRSAAEFAACRDAFEDLKRDVHRAIERFTGPGAVGRGLLTGTRAVPPAHAAARIVAYRLRGGDVAQTIAPFARRWIRGRAFAPDALRIHVSGEVYMRVAQADDLFDRLVRLSGFGLVDLRISSLWGYLEYLPEYRVECGHERLATLAGTSARAADPALRRGLRNATRATVREVREAGRNGWFLRHVLARPLYAAAGLPMPPTPRQLLDEAREVLPTLRPHGELALYIGEALRELREGADLVLNLAPSGCMVATMGDVMTPAIIAATGAQAGRVQSLFSSDGEIDEELLSVALLRARASRP